MNDDLLAWREHFPALDECLYLISHSLGCMPAPAAEQLGAFLDLWYSKSVAAWEDWLPEIDQVGNRIARLLSAPEGTVVMHANVSMVQAVIASCFEFTPARNKVVYTDIEFPSVSYIWQAEQRRGAQIHLVRSDDGVTVDVEQFCAAIDEHTAVVPISHAIYGSAALVDVKRICRKAAQVGAHVIVDCYQTIGTVPIDIVDIGASFACGGVLKYLCGGPGAAFLYVREDLIPTFEPRVTGWFANEAPFSFAMPTQSYAEGIWRYMGGTPAVAPLYQARAGLDIIGQIGVHSIRQKSQRQTQRIIELVEERGFKLKTPKNPAERAGSVVFDFGGAAHVTRELNENRFYCDFRPGAGIRIAPHFYNSDAEIERFFQGIDYIRRT